jgi:uncharacterized protein (DUF58 family)
MNPLFTKPQLTPLLSNDALARLERMRLNSTRRFTNRSRGEHLSGRGGTSTEFHDYRDYAAGDDLRYVDWNIFSRLHRPYLKLYRQEEEMHVVVIVDASTSMLFDNKLLRARQLAAAFGMMGLIANERVSVYAPAKLGNSVDRLPPSRGRVSLRKMFSFLEKIEGGGDAPLEHAIQSVLKHHKGRGVVAVLSDFLTLGDMKRAFNMLYSTGLEIFAVQILGPSEIDPEVSGDLRFVDAETQHTLDVSNAADLLSIYQEYRQQYQADLEQMCLRRDGRFLSISADEPVEQVLFDLMRRRGWVTS